LGLANRAIDSGIPFEQEEGLIDTQEVQDFLKSTAQAAIVLLKNEASLLPLQPEKIRRLAVVGPNAKLQVLSGGGSASLRAIRSSSPLQGILAAAEKESIQVEYTPGVFAHRYLPLVNPLVRSARGGQGHLDLEFFETDPTQSDAEVQAIHSLSVDTATNFMVSPRLSTMGTIEGVFKPLMISLVRQSAQPPSRTMLYARIHDVHPGQLWNLGVWSRYRVSIVSLRRYNLALILTATLSRAF
jgi:hypothetical protein